MAMETGLGTLYDADENELGAVRYRLEREEDGDGGGPSLVWRGELNLEPETADVPIAAGRYLLELEDGGRGEIDLEPFGASSGAVGQVAFSGAAPLPRSASFDEDGP